MAEAGSNTFANDGSFLEMFKKRMEQQKDKEKSKDVDEPAASVESTRVIECTQTEDDSTVTDSHDGSSASAEPDEKPVHKPYQVVP